MEQIQLLKDPTVIPTDAVIADALGKVNTVFVKFTKDLENLGIFFMGWRYYNDGKAWLNKGEHRYTTARGAKKITPIFWLSIWEGFFKVSFFFGANMKEELLCLPLSDDARQKIKNTQATGNFLAVIIDVTDEKQFNDIYELAKLRKKRVK